MGWCMFLPDFMFVDDEASLVNVFPIGAILSLSGVLSMALRIERIKFAPELQAWISAQYKYHFSPECLLKAGVYAVAASILHAHADLMPAQLCHPRAHGTLSKEAADFMERALFEEPEWRLHIETALQHPWLKKFKNHSGNQTDQ